MFGRKKKQPQVIYRDRIVYQSSADDIARQERQEDYVTRAKDEYARLQGQVRDALDARDRGDGFAVDLLNRRLGQMQVLVDSISVITGKDRILVSYDLELQSHLRVTSDEEFPLNSFLSSGSLIWNTKVAATAE
jgi:hypothetical protein